MPIANTDQGELFYAARGETGAPIIFVHGAGGNHLIWNGQLAALAGSARVYALDLPGHGRSPGPGRTRVADYAAVLRRFMDALSLERAVIAGHSMGGAIAQTFAVNHPERTQGLVLVGTGSRLRVLPAFLSGLLSDFPATAHLLTEHEFGPEADPALKARTEEQLIACGQVVVHGDFSACDAFDLGPALESIGAPALVLCGSRDRMTPVKYADYMASHLPHAEQVTVPEAGHYVMLEQPEAVNEAIRRFIERLR